MSSLVWKGQLTLGELTVAVRLFSGPAAETIHFTNLHSADRCLGSESRTGQQVTCKAEDRAIPRSEIVRGFEYEKDRFFVVTDQLLEAHKPKRSDSLPLVITAAHAIDPIFHEATYYLHPDGTDEEKYVGLQQALREADRVAVGKIVLQRERWIVIRPVQGGMVAHTLFYAKEARLLSAFRQVAIPSMEIRHQVAEAIGGQMTLFDPKTTVDEATNRVQAAIQAAILSVPELPIPRKRPTGTRRKKAA